MYGQSSGPASILKKIILVAVLAFIGYSIYHYFIRTTDITPYLNYEKAQLEDELGVSLEPNSKMVKKIDAYTNGTVTVDGDHKNGIAMFYIDGIRSGIHIDNSKYSMFGIELGIAGQKVEKVMTFKFDRHFNVLDDMMKGSSTATFYCNSTTNECIVVICNGTTNRVVAITYFNNMRKATENLSSL